MYIFQILNIFLNSRFSAHLWRTDTGAGPSHGMEKLFPGKQNYGKDLEPWLIITFKWASGSMTQLSKLFYLSWKYSLEIMYRYYIVLVFDTVEQQQEHNTWFKCWKVMKASEKKS